MILTWGEQRLALRMSNGILLVMDYRLRLARLIGVALRAFCLWEAGSLQILLSLETNS